jgi:hypothetical protein
VRVFTQASLDDGLLCATVALRLGALYQLTGDPRSAVQILRSGLNALQLARDTAISQAVHAPVRQDDQLALSAASVACFFDVAVPNVSNDALQSVVKRPAAGAYGGSGLFGAESQVCRGVLPGCLSFHVLLW